MSELERIVEMEGAFDRRHPDPSKDYGVHGMNLRFVLKGAEGAVHFLVYTNMHLPHVREAHRRRAYQEAVEGEPLPPYDIDAPMGADIGYHSPVALWEGQRAHDNCPYRNGQPCYGDGSALAADEFMPTFLAGGSDAVWRMLEQRYADLLERIGTAV